MLIERILRRIKTIVTTMKTERFFRKGRQLEWDQRGCWKLYPMPSQTELDHFYQNIYWSAMGSHLGNKVVSRDLSQFEFMRSQPFFKNIIKKTEQIRALNYGAGHGGVSYLFWALGWDVTNLELGQQIQEPVENIRWTGSLESIDNSDEEARFDIIYCSHVVEHLPSFTDVLKRMSSLLKPDGVTVIEVPNCAKRPNLIGYVEGGCDGKIVAEHTYYFTPEFFESIGGEVFRFDGDYSNGKFMQVQTNHSDFIRWVCDYRTIKSYLG